MGFSGFTVANSVEVRLQPFDRDQVAQYVRCFQREYSIWEDGALDPRLVETTAGQLLAALDANSRLAALARNPFLLSALALIHRAEGRLPRHRVQVYELFGRALWEAWGAARRLVMGDASADLSYDEEAVPVLGELALRMHESFPSGIAPERFVMDAVCSAVEASLGSDAAERSAREFLRRAGNEAQILVERGDKEWSFLHLTFQEFFAAAGLHATERFDTFAWSHRYSARWEEVLRLGVGYLALVQKRPQAAREFVDRILRDRGPFGRQTALAVLLAVETGEHATANWHGPLVEQFVTWVFDMPGSATDQVLGNIALTSIGCQIGCRVAESLRSSFSRARSTACRALGFLRAREWSLQIATLLRNDEDASVRRNAAVALGLFGGTGALDDLLESVLGDPEPAVARAAAEALRAQPQQDVRDDLIRTLGSPSAPRTARLAVLRALDPARCENAALAIVGATRDQDPAIRGAAVAVLSSMTDLCQEALDALAPLLRDSDEGVRVRAADYLGKEGSPRSVSALIEALERPGPEEERVAAALGLRHLDVDRAEAVLRRQLATSSGHLGRAVALALVFLGGHLSLPRLLDGLEDEPQWFRGEAIRAIARLLPMQSAMAAMRRAAEEEGLWLRLEAARALAPQDLTTATRTLCALLREKAVAPAAAECLGKVGDIRAIDPLRAAAHSPNVGLRTAARGALWELSGVLAGDWWRGVSWT